MTTASEQKPIIRIKRRRKKGHEGSHGAWKVAYADFVTAMMAFFLLMWLVSITDQDDKERISEYFNPFQEVSDTQEVEVEAGDISMMNGGRAAGAEIHEDQERDATQQTSTSEAIKDSDFDWEMVSIPRVEYERLIENEISQKSIDPDAKRRLDLNDIFGGEARKEAERGEDDGFEPNRFTDLREQLENMTEEMKAFSEYANVFQIDEVTEGLRIQFIDQEEFSMFKSGSHSLSSEAKEMISLFGSVLKDVPNNIAIMGHTDAVPFNRKDYSNWELSTDRANAARRAIVQSGVPQEKIVSVEGKAAQDLLYPTHPNAPENRRINFIILH